MKSTRSSVKITVFSVKFPHLQNQVQAFKKWIGIWKGGGVDLITWNITTHIYSHATPTPSSKIRKDFVRKKEICLIVTFEFTERRIYKKNGTPPNQHGGGGGGGG